MLSYNETGSHFFFTIIFQVYLVTDLNQVKKFWVLVYQIFLSKYFENLVKNLSSNGGKMLNFLVFTIIGNDE